MKAPDNIYIDDLAVVNDCVTKISLKGLPNFSEYIRKDALLEWLEAIKVQSLELKEKGYGDVFYGAQIAILEEVINKLNQM